MHKLEIRGVGGTAGDKMCPNRILLTGRSEQGKEGKSKGRRQPRRPRRLTVVGEQVPLQGEGGPEQRPARLALERPLLRVRLRTETPRSARSGARAPPHARLPDPDPGRNTRRARGRAPKCRLRFTP